MLSDCNIVCLSVTLLVLQIGGQSSFQVRIIRASDGPQRAFGRFSRTHPAQDTQNIIHPVAAAQVLQSGQRFGVGHARLNFRKTVEGMFEFTSKKLSESTVLWSPALTLHPTSRTGSARTPSGRYFSFELLLHRGNGKYRQLPQPPNKCFPIAAPLVVFAPPMPPASRCGVSALQ